MVKGVKSKHLQPIYLFASPKENTFTHKNKTYIYATHKVLSISSDEAPAYLRMGTETGLVGHSNQLLSHHALKVPQFYLKSVSFAEMLQLPDYAPRVYGSGVCVVSFIVTYKYF